MKIAIVWAENTKFIGYTDWPASQGFDIDQSKRVELHDVRILVEYNGITPAGKVHRKVLLLPVDVHIGPVPCLTIENMSIVYIPKDAEVIKSYEELIKEAEEEEMKERAAQSGLVVSGPTTKRDLRRRYGTIKVGR